jgi:hypothetical protein
MKIPKPTDADKERFRALVPDGPAVETKPMFGNVAGFVNGNMFMGLFGSDIGLRLPPELRDQLLASGGTPFGPADRPMKEYVCPPVSPDDEQFGSLIGEALTHVSTFPPKVPKPRKKRA